MSPPGTRDPVALQALSVGYRRRRRSRWRRTTSRLSDGAELHTVLSGLSVTAKAGDLTALLGPNGTGKSTLLRTLAGLQSPLAGRVLLAGTDLATMTAGERARQVAVVLTARVDTGPLNATELVGLGRHPHTGPTGRLGAQDLQVVTWALHAVGAQHLATRPVSEMSDGERQRVLTARALAQEPALLVLDEPTAFLDAPTRVALTGTLRTLARHRGIGVLISTHDLELALRVADTVWMLDSSGRLHVGPPEQLVLDGTVATTFDSDTLRFDPATGGFGLVQPMIGTARLQVGGAVGAVVARALQRHGWLPVTSGLADIEVVQRAAPSTGFEVISGGAVRQVADTAGLLSALADLAGRAGEPVGPSDGAPFGP